MSNLTVVEKRRHAEQIPNPSGILRPSWPTTDMQGAGLIMVMQARENKKVHVRVEELVAGAWSPLASGNASGGGLDIVGPFSHSGDDLRFIGVDPDGVQPEVEFVVTQVLPGGRGRKYA